MPSILISALILVLVGFYTCYVVYKRIKQVKEHRFCGCDSCNRCEQGKRRG